MPALYSKDSKNSPIDRVEIGRLEKALSYHFNDINLLIEALTHSSFVHENPDIKRRDNERLEFLGDSVLGLTITDYLYNTYRDMDESRMAYIRSYLVRRSVLYELANHLSLGDYIYLGRGEEITGGRSKRSILSNAMEALIGAIFLDSNYEKAKDVIMGLIRKTIDDVVSSGAILDYKSELQRRAELKFGKLPEYRVVKEEGEEHEKIFEVEVYIDSNLLGKGKGKSKKDAEHEAARSALSNPLFTNHE